MSELYDFYVNTDCKTKLHIGNYVFTIAELFCIACDSLSTEEFEKHRA